MNLLWTEWADQELFEDVPHRQVVFTLPKRLRIFFRYDRLFLGELAGLCPLGAMTETMQSEVTSSAAGSARSCSCGLGLRYPLRMNDSSPSS